MLAQNAAEGPRSFGSSTKPGPVIYGSNFKQTGRAGPRSSQSVDDPPPRMLTEQVQRVQRSLPTANGPCWLTPARMLRDHSKTRLRVAVRPSPPIEARRSTNPSGKRTPQLRSATSCLSAMRALDRMLRIYTEVRYVAGIARCVRSICLRSAEMKNWMGQRARYLCDRRRRSGRSSPP